MAMAEINRSDFNKPVYVLLYHPWLEGFEDYFAAHLAWLNENGFESISPEALILYVKGESVSIPERPLVMTFDDGTIENYTVVYPLLKRYGFTGTVFAPTAESYTSRSGKDWWKETEREGVLRMEGHSHTHSLVFINDRVEGFYTGASSEPKPPIKGMDHRLGSPLFGQGYELVETRFIPCREFVEACVDYVRKRGGEFLFGEKNWKEEMLQFVPEYPGDRGRYETEEERKARIEEELWVSKQIIEDEIGGGKKVVSFAYPFGAYHIDLIELLKKLGYKYAFNTDPGGNRQGDDPFLLKRMMILDHGSFGGIESIFKEFL
jgi:peptidoglycan/xylan/chitin deacetylase (PgdA/CDA1 family)